MKKYILKSLFVSVLCMLAASCQDTEIVETLEASQAQIVFPIALDSPSARSRSSWDGYTGLGNGNEYDSHIDFNQFIVQIEANGKTYPVTGIIQLKGGNKFVGIVDEEIKSATLQNAKISIFANMGKESVAETFSQDAENIPMWGVKTVSKLEFAPGKREEVSDPVFMLRAMAKMEVALTPECAAEYDLKAVTLNKHNATGYCLPVGVDAATNTQNMSTAGVFNPKTQGEQTSLQFEPATENSYVVYLPEVAKGTTEEDCLKIEVQLLPKNAPEGTEPEIGTFAVMNYPQNGEPEAINIIRNHWYKYTISGFAASEIQLDYVELDWQPVNFEVGGEGFLFLNKDVIEIYNSNIDADQLKFSSSSPIKSIVLKDLYTHANNGEIVEGTTDGVSAYYISKFGQKIQLGSDPGFDISDKEAAIARETVILSNISARAEADKLNGGITITSPFMADPASQVTELQQNSHYDTPRYLEFLVTNEQDLTATFRVIQYPPVVITNEEGFYSYRDDHVLTDDPLEKPFDLFTYDNDFHSFMTSSMYLVHPHDFTDEPRPSEEVWASLPEMKLVRPEDFKGEPNDAYWNTVQQDRNYSWMKKSDNSLTWFPLYPNNSCPSQGTAGEMWVEIRYGFYNNTITYNNGKNTKTFSGIHRVASGDRPYSDFFYRDMYKSLPGELAITNKSYKGTALSPYYKAEVIDKDGKKQTRIFRDHLRWNAQPVFWSKFVYKYYDQAGQGASYSGKSVYKHKGQVDMYEYGPSEDGGKTWGRYIYSNNLYKFANNRMYKINTTISSDSYTIGYPNLSENGETMNSVNNARLISPTLMLASQLGETNHQQFLNNASYYDYIIPDVKEMYRIAARHCREYVETTFKDDNGDHMWNDGEEIIEYHDWRLPTKAEIEMIIDYQSNSRAIDRVLDAQYYYCVTGTADSDDVKNIHNWVSSEIPGFDSQTSKGYYIRCVRDVKAEQEDNK